MDLLKLHPTISSVILFIALDGQRATLWLEEAPPCISETQGAKRKEGGIEEGDTKLTVKSADELIMWAPDYLPKPNINNIHWSADCKICAQISSWQTDFQRKNGFRMVKASVASIFKITWLLHKRHLLGTFYHRVIKVKNKHRRFAKG